MGIIIKEVTDPGELKDFINFPFTLYKDHPYFVPVLKSDERAVLNKDKNPAFDYCDARYWLAYKDGKVVGRIAGIINKTYIERSGNKYMRFGWFDFEEDLEIATALTGQVENWAREKNMTAVVGPLGFTNFDHNGMLVEGYDQMGTMATLYNYAYYPELLEKAGYKKDIDWIEFKINVPEKLPEKINRIASIIEKRLQLKVVQANKTKDLLPYGKAVFDLMNSAYSDLYGVVPLTEKQIQYYIKQYLSFLRTDFVTLIVDDKDELAAFGITMPSLSIALQKSRGKLFPFGFLHILKAMKKNEVVDMLLVAIRKDLQGKGVNAILMRELYESYIRNNIKYAESNPELEDNKKVQSIWGSFDAVQHKRRRCYIKSI